MRVTISIVSHNQDDLVQSLLLSVDQNLISDNVELTFVIRNNVYSNYNYSSSKFKLIVVNNANPHGFGKNHNLNFKIIKSDFFLVLNPDIIFHKNFNLFKYISLVLSHDLSISSPTVVDCKLDRLDHVRHFITLNDLILRRFTNYSNHPHHWIGGMFMFFKSHVFSKLGGFNESFFMYVEDTDICLRCNGNIGILSNFYVQHIEQRKSFKNIKHLIWHFRSLLKYFKLYLFSDIYNKPPNNVHYINYEK